MTAISARQLRFKPRPGRRAQHWTTGAIAWQSKAAYSLALKVLWCCLTSRCPKVYGEGISSADIQKLGDLEHWGQFVDAILGKGSTGAHFGYSGPLTEAVLLGSVASRFPKTTLQWDAAAMKFSNVPEANLYVRRPYRQGWQVTGL